jgi:hypothetical protein
MQGQWAVRNLLLLLLRALLLLSLAEALQQVLLAA